MARISQDNLTNILTPRVGYNWRLAAQIAAWAVDHWGDSDEMLRDERAGDYLEAWRNKNRGPLPNLFVPRGYVPAKNNDGTGDRWWVA